jgi:hypothetical protein
MSKENIAPKMSHKMKLHGVQSTRTRSVSSMKEVQFQFQHACHYVVALLRTMFVLTLAVLSL